MAGARLAREKRNELTSLLAAHFTRREPARQAGKYIDALMSDLPDKNCWSLAQHAGDVAPDKMQRLLERAAWDQAAAMRTVRDFAVAGLACPDGLTVLVLDESGQVKQGDRTAGVKPQYVGCLGRVASAINFVNATYSTARGHALAGSRLRIPEGQLADAYVRDRMGIPAHLQPATRPQPGAQMLAEMLEAGIEIPWVAADEVYGQDPGLRELCEERGTGYVLGVACSFRVTLPSGARMRADKILAMVPGRAWTITSCGAGSKGDRRYARAWIAAQDRRRHLLIRRNLRDPARLDYFWCFVPEGRPVCLAILVKVCGRRRTVEEDHEFGKDQFGYDHARVRLYTPVMRHLTLVMAALAICAVTTADLRDTSPAPPLPVFADQEPPENPGLIPFTVPEIRRLCILFHQALHGIAHGLHWSWWRRRHQARARWYHHRTRLGDLETYP
jgi:SRSO17 transposase